MQHGVFGSLTSMQVQKTVSTWAYPSLQECYELFNRTSVRGVSYAYPNAIHVISHVWGCSRWVVNIRRSIPRNSLLLRSLPGPLDMQVGCSRAFGELIYEYFHRERVESFSTLVWVFAPRQSVFSKSKDLMPMQAKIVITHSASEIGQRRARSIPFGMRRFQRPIDARGRRGPKCYQQIRPLQTLLSEYHFKDDNETCESLMILRGLKQSK